MKDIKTEIKKFISNVIDRDYKKASSNLSTIVDKKMERKILNNNISIF
jgi:ribosomal protein S20|tara:strand:+ start:67 stop:210 length:144 start_codon:yes stop_codon:yes gene_type:complete